MVRNVEADERIARLTVAAMASLAGIMAARGRPQLTLGIVAASALVTGLTSYCPLKAALRSSGRICSARSPAT
jgi:hypothetical protein